MRVGLLQCDDVAPALIGSHGNYPDMIETLLKRVDGDIDVRRWACHRQQLPDSVEAADVWITTGSKCSAYDDEPWIHDLTGFVCGLWQARRRLVGICFGHQIIAQALGGRVERSPRGWGIGAYAVELSQRQPWMRPWPGDKLNLLASHRDQVAALPPDGTLLARSAFCPIYMMQLGDAFLGIQGHPEFTKAYSSALTRLRQDTIPAERVATAMDSLQTPIHDDVAARWIIHFMRGRTMSRDGQ